MRFAICNCCGAHVRGPLKQWPNRDRGFSQCGSCTDWGLERGETLEYVRDMAGEPGVHRPEGRLEAVIRADWPEWDCAPLAVRRSILAAYAEGRACAKAREPVKPWAGRAFPYDSAMGRVWRAGHAEACERNGIEPGELEAST